MNRIQWLGGGLILAVVGLAALPVFRGAPIDDATSLITNSDDGVWTMAGEEMPSSGVTGDFTHGILTLENSTDEIITLKRIELVDVVGDIKLIDSYIAPRGREYLYVSSEDRFPPQDTILDLQPLEGFEVLPGAQGEGPERNEEVVLHLQVPGGQEMAGYSGFCVEFRVADDTSGRRKCNDHAFFVCRDVDSPSCGPEDR